MDNALTVLEKTQVNEDFRVSTVLFSNRFETRVFTELDELPSGLVRRVSDHMARLVTMDKTATTTDKGYRSEDDDDDDYDPYGDDDDYETDAVEYIAGIAVDSFGFEDAACVHENVVASVRTFVEVHKRIVAYV